VATLIEEPGTDRKTLTLTVPSPCPGLHLSPEAFWDICAANPELRLTRTADGVLIVMAPAGSDAGARNSDLSGQLWAWNRGRRLGVTFDSSAGFTLPNGFVHAPDASWVTCDRWDALTPKQKRKFAPICPDFVAELMSPSDRRGETRDRLVEFMTQGARPRCTTQVANSSVLFSYGGE
jgi:Uma2 family endonuclease